MSDTKTASSLSTTASSDAVSPVRLSSKNSTLEHTVDETPMTKVKTESLPSISSTRKKSGADSAGPGAHPSPNTTTKNRATETSHPPIQPQLQPQSQRMDRTKSAPICLKPQPHPIAIKPKPIAIAPAAQHSAGSGSQLKSVGLMKSVSASSSKGPDEITLTTSKNWILPPRPKVKKNLASKTSKNNANTPHNNEKLTNSKSKTETSAANNGYKLKINSQIHSNINFYTNNQLDLKVQLQNVTKENDNLKKILVKLNKEINNLELMKNENLKLADSANSKVKEESPIASGIPLNVDLNAAKFSQKTQVTDTIIPDVLLSESNTIDPINLSYNLDSKRVKTEKLSPSSASFLGLDGGITRSINTTSSLGINPLKETANDYYLSPKDIMINPAPKPAKVKKVESKAAAVSQKKAQILLAQQLKQKQLMLEKQKQELEKAAASPKLQECGHCTVGALCVCASSTAELKPKTKSASAVASSATSSSSLVPAQLSVADTTSDWFARSYVDFEMMNEELEDLAPVLAVPQTSLLIDTSVPSGAGGTLNSPATGPETKGLTESPRFDFRFDKNDDFMMY